MSATFWNMRRRKRALEAAKKTVVTPEPATPTVTEEAPKKPVTKGGGKNGK